jgi:anaerobic selenocysteine-containing dehydrogenase
MYAHVTEGGVLEGVEARRDHGLTGGFLCKKGQMIRDWVYSPERLLYPMKRAGPKGSGRFERITWDEAFESIEAEMKKTIADHGPEAILPYEYAGHMGVISRYYPYRLFNRIGASELQYTICSESGKRALSYHYGTSAGMDPEDVVNSKYVVVWGFNPAWTGQHIFRQIMRAKAKRVVVDPIRSETAERADLHIQLRPGTDSALALGIIRYAVKNGLYDEEFVSRYTHGFDELCSSVATYDPERVCGICGITLRDFNAFAEGYCTTKPAAILMGFGLQRNVNGGEMVRAISLLPAITGNIGISGGGFFYSNSPYFTVDLENLKGTRPGRRSINMIKLGEALLAKDLKPPIKFLFIYNTNPAAVCPDLNKVREGLSREDLFTVVHDLFLTDTADYADIVLPATSYFETFDIQFAYGGMYVALNEKAIAPLGESMSNADVASELMRRMGHSDLVEEPETLARRLLESGRRYMKGVTLNELKREGFVRLRTPRVPHIAFEDHVFYTPTGKIELSSTFAEMNGIPPVPGYAGTKGRYPLRLLSPFHRDLSKSQYHNIPSIFSAKGQVVEISPEDAEMRNVKSGDMVKIFNERGDCTMRAMISTRVKRGVSLTYAIPWPKLVEGRKTVNFTTSSRASDLGGGSTFHTNYVEIERV